MKIFFIEKLFFIISIFSPIYLCSQDHCVRIGFAGDTMLGRLVSQEIKRMGNKHVWGDLLPILKANDLNIVNLETTLTQSDKPVPKVFNFKADPDQAAALVEGNIGLVNLANNHSMDFGPQGLHDTLRALDKKGILHVGAGMDYNQAVRPVIITKNNLKIGILGYTDNEPTWQAGPNKPGTNYIKVGETKTITQAIKNLRGLVDLLIISIHWGPNWNQAPPSNFQEFAHYLIDQGVDIIHGHSSHIFQGIEQYKRGFIMHQLGDFVDDYAVDQILRNDRSFFVTVTVCGDQIRGVHLLPTKIHLMQVNKATGEDYREAVEQIKDLSANLGTTITVERAAKIPSAKKTP